MNNNEIVPGFDDDKDEYLQIRLQKIEEVYGCLVLYLKGWVGEENYSYFQKYVNRIIQSGFTKLIFNCAGLKIWHSLGVGCFVSFLKDLKPRGGDLVLLEMQPESFEYFQKLVGFSQHFHFRKDLEEAVAFFTK